MPERTRSPRRALPRANPGQCPPQVIEGAETAIVALTDAGGRTERYDAKLVGSNPEKDVAVLQASLSSALALPLP